MSKHLDIIMMSATDDAPFFLDDISSIESSSRRERKFSEERICEQETIIKSLTYAVQRLADTLDTKEEELQAKDTELQAQKVKLQTQKAELAITQRVDVDLETKVLDLMIENAELKNLVVDIQDTPISRRGRNLQMTPAITDDFSSFQRELSSLQGGHDDKGNGENMAEENMSTKLNKPFLALLPRKLLSLKAGGRSLLTNNRMSWSKKGGLTFPKLKPMYLTESSQDDMSDLSSSLGSES